MTFLYLFLSLVGIFIAAELFTNAIEWFGKHLDLGEGAVGSVLAAVGTALPETSVAVVAIIAREKAHTEAGIGAILGAPMMLSTLAMFITGAAVLIFSASKVRKPVINADYQIVGRDLRSFFLVYAIALAAAFIPGRVGKVPVALALVLIYVLYVRRTILDSGNSDGQGHVRPLHFRRRADFPHIKIVIVQLIAGIALMLIGAKVFVDSVTVMSASLGIAPLVLSLIITPIATELPEKFNSIIWIRRRKDTLALGNITGAMVFQSSVLPAIGILFTPWSLDPHALISMVVALLASSTIWAEMTLRKRLSPYSLLIGGVFYALFPIAVFWVLPMMGYSVKG